MKEETTYREIEFSIEKAQIEGNKVFALGNPDYKGFPVMDCKKVRKSKYYILYIDEKERVHFVNKFGKHENTDAFDLRILEKINHFIPLV